LLDQLQRPCVSFAAIAVQFGVSRERVRQWHAEYLPDAPKGLERRRLCQLHHARRRLLTDAVFGPFYRHARAAFPPDQIALIRTRDGLRARVARIGGRLVAIKKARRRTARHDSGAPVYVLSACRRTADLVYYHLDVNNFLCVPSTALPVSGTTYLDAPGSKYWLYRNRFPPAIEPPDPSRPVATAARLNEGD
jgi:hypothetical protein